MLHSVNFTLLGSGYFLIPMNILEPCSGRHKFSKPKNVYIKDETNGEKKKLPFTDGIKALEEIFFKTNNKLVGLII